MSKIGVERLAAGHHQKHRTEGDHADGAVLKNELYPVERIYGGENPGIVTDMHAAGNGDGDEPDDHDRPEHRRHLRGTAALRSEQRNQDHDGDRRHIVAESGRGQPETFDCR